MKIIKGISDFTLTVVLGLPVLMFIALAILGDLSLNSLHSKNISVIKMAIDGAVDKVIQHEDSK